MIRINDKDATRVLNHLLRARKIIEYMKEKSEDGEVMMDEIIAENCLYQINEILICLNHTLYE